MTRSLAHVRKPEPVIDADRGDRADDVDDAGAAEGGEGAGTARRRSRGRPRGTSAAAAPEPIKALDRGLQVLRALAEERRATLTNVALQADTTPPSAYRALITLQRHGLVDFDETRQEWTIGIEAFRIGTAFLARTGLVELARPTLGDLMHATQETANLGIADRGQVVFVSQVEARNPIRAFFDTGSRGHMHASGIGKALLAELEPAGLAEVLESRGLPRFTARTLTDAGALAADLELTRARGWSFDDEERHDGMRCLGAPIFDADGCAVAGVSVSGPTVRCPDEVIETTGRRVRRAADEITRRLGG